MEWMLRCAVSELSCRIEVITSATELSAEADQTKVLNFESLVKAVLVVTKKCARLINLLAFFHEVVELS